MKKRMLVLLAIFLGFGLAWGLGCTDCSAGEDNGEVGNRMDTDQMLLAHHVGNRPDDAPDIDDVVHGGDYDPDDPWDPTNPDTPPEPGGNGDSGGQPDIPGNGGRPDDPGNGGQPDSTS